LVKVIDNDVTYTTDILVQETFDLTYTTDVLVQETFDLTHSTDVYITALPRILQHVIESANDIIKKC